MLKYKNFGRKSLTELVDKLSSMGLHFGMDTSKIMAEEGVKKCAIRKRVVSLVERLVIVKLY